jgi:hypothetical protein
MAKDTFPLREIARIERLSVGCPPSLQGGVELGSADAAGHLYCQRAFSSDLRLLDLLTTGDHEEADSGEQAADEYPELSGICRF